jgi:hypothetical protein
MRASPQLPPAILEDAQGTVPCFYLLVGPDYSWKEPNVWTIWFQHERARQDAGERLEGRVTRVKAKGRELALRRLAERYRAWPPLRLRICAVDGPPSRKDAYEIALCNRRGASSVGPGGLGPASRGDGHRQVRPAGQRRSMSVGMC